MPDNEMFGEPKQGFLARLGRIFSPGRNISFNASVRRSERLDLKVPSEKAAAVQAAVERWLREYGVGAEVTTEDAGDGKSRIRAKLDGSDAQKINFAAEDTQSTLQDLLADSMR